MKIALNQIDCVLGNIDKNIIKHFDFIIESKKQGAELALFPELSLTGYLLEDRVKQIAITQHELATLFSDRNLPEIDILAGYVEKDQFGYIYNSQALLSLKNNNCTLTANSRKINLPTYGMFDELRHFNRGSSIEFFSLPQTNTPCTTLICEDMWHPLLPVSAMINHQTLPSLIFAPAASPARGYFTEKPQNLDGWEKNISFFSTSLGVFVLNPQRVGVEDSLIFAGGSMAALPDGTVLQADFFKEDILIVDIDLSDVTSKRQKTQVVSKDDIDILRRILKNGDK